MYSESTNRLLPDSKIFSSIANLMTVHPALRQTINDSVSYSDFLQNLKSMALSFLSMNSAIENINTYIQSGINGMLELNWRNLAAIRVLDYINNTGRELVDSNDGKRRFINEPFKPLWEFIAYGNVIAGNDYYVDIYQLFRQLTGVLKPKTPDRSEVEEWMDRHPSGLEERIIEMREINKKRILSIIIQRIDDGLVKSERYKFSPDMTWNEKYKLALQWWDTRHFHLKFAIRTPELLNEMLDNTLSDEVLSVLAKAKEKKIPIFVNPYYLSLLLINPPDDIAKSDLAIRDYVFVSRELVEEYGAIKAWEKEDNIEPGKPNIAGWILPTYHNLHRRYPEVAILIPDTVGRACGGLCVSCQRMYEFQSGYLNFEIDKLRPKETWTSKLRKLLTYFEFDTQLRDILITGGDALMSRDTSLKTILNEVYEMALRKKTANMSRPDGEKYAEMTRIRLGTRLPVYLPQRITPQLISILSDFRKKAEKIGFKQFVIQTHFETAMEVTPESKKAIEALLSAGWIVTNQQVFITAAARRGHSAKLRKVLNDIGVLPYYIFSVKGFNENKHNFATNARSMQESAEEKIIGRLSENKSVFLAQQLSDGKNIVDKIRRFRRENDVPFIATGRNVLNLPGVGKSLTFRTIGITRNGRRVLEFEHDSNRRHSPIIKQMGKVVIVESKSVAEFIRQMMRMGEDGREYETLYGYSIGITEKRFPLYKCPKYDFEITDTLTNLKLENINRTNR